MRKATFVGILVSMVVISSLSFVAQVKSEGNELGLEAKSVDENKEIGSDYVELNLKELERNIGSTLSISLDNLEMNGSNATFLCTSRDVVAIKGKSKFPNELASQELRIVYINKSISPRDRPRLFGF
ncbi:MAG: hypothetical protein J7L20_00700 [Thermoplasmata archaeon]|nr:hypothetical protein [Thermoplasmata archaeon]